MNKFKKFAALLICVTSLSAYAGSPTNPERTGDLLAKHLAPVKSAASLQTYIKITPSKENALNLL